MDGVFISVCAIIILFFVVNQWQMNSDWMVTHRCSTCGPPAETTSPMRHCKADSYLHDSQRHSATAGGPQVEHPWKGMGYVTWRTITPLLKPIATRSNVL